MTWKFIAAAAATLIFVAASPASATVTIFTSQAAFNAATHDRVTDNFDNVADDNSSVSYSSGYFASLFRITADNAALMNYGAATDKGGWNSGDVMAFQGGTNAYFHFYSPVTAFSIELMTINPGATVTVSGVGFNSPVVTGPRPSTTFFGLTSTNGVTDFQVAALGNFGEFDNLTLAVAGPALAASPSGAPEPASWALIITGLGLTGAALRRGRRTMAA